MIVRQTNQSCLMIDHIENIITILMKMKDLTRKVTTLEFIHLTMVQGKIK